MNKFITLLLLITGLSACIPYNKYYNANNNAQQGFYPQGSYGNYSSSSNDYNNDYANSYYDSSSSANNQNQELNYQGVYGRLDIPVDQSYQPTQYYGGNKGLEKGVVGVGRTMPTPFNNNQMNNFAKTSKANLIMPNYWRMAHPSIGKGLELVNQQERMALNNALNSINIKKPADIAINGKQVSILALNNGQNTNSQGFMCKDTYVIKANYDKIEKMTAKFCRHPNWNEWVLSEW